MTTTTAVACVNHSEMACASAVICCSICFLLKPLVFHKRLNPYYAVLHQVLYLTFFICVFLTSGVSMVCNLIKKDNQNSETINAKIFITQEIFISNNFRSLPLAIEA